jgi:glucose-6-phosphate 1-dehydrogenase
MTLATADALVFFGATGDLAHKMIFPALQALTKSGRLNIPVIGVAKAGWDIDDLRARAKDSLQKFGGGVDKVAFKKLMGRLDLPRFNRHSVYAAFLSLDSNFSGIS